MTQGLPSVRNAARGAFVATRARAYAQAGHSVLVISPPCLEALTSALAGCKVQWVDSLEELVRVLRGFNADVVACHSPDPATLPGRAAYVLAGKVRLVVWIHGYEALYTGLHGYQPPVKVLPSLVRDYLRLRRLSQVLKEADAVVYVSEWLRQTAERNTGVVAHKTYVIPNPVNTSLFRPGIRGVRREIRAIVVKSLRRQYGLDVAIRAFSGMRGVTLTIIGDGPLFSTYSRLASNLNSPVVFRHAVIPHDEMAMLYPSYDVYVAPSRTETQGLAMCEAMSCGLPVVASRVGGISEFVVDGESGVLVRPNDPRALRRAIEELVGTPGKILEMGVKARETMLRKCEEDSIIQSELLVLQGSGEGQGDNVRISPAHNEVQQGDSGLFSN